MIVHVQNQVLTHHGQSDQRNISSGKGENHTRQAPAATRPTPCPTRTFRPREPAASVPPGAIPLLLRDPARLWARTRAEAAGRHRADPAPGSPQRRRPSRPPPPSRSCRVPHGGNRVPGGGGGGRERRRSRLKRTAEGRPGTARWGRSLRRAAHPGFTAIPGGSRAQPPPGPTEGSPTPALTRPWRRRCGPSRTALTDGRPRRAPLAPLAARDGGGGAERGHWLIPPSAAFPPMGRWLRPGERSAERLSPLKGQLWDTALGLTPGQGDGRAPKPCTGTAAPGGRRAAARPRGAGTGEVSSAAKPAGGRQAADLCFRHRPPMDKPTHVGSEHPTPGPRGQLGAVQLLFPLSFN